MSVEQIIALITAVTALVTAVGAFWHSVGTRRQLPPPGSGTLDK